MDIQQRLTSSLNRPLSAQITDQFTLKLAQLVEAKVIEVNREQQTIILALTQPKGTLQVTTDDPSLIKQGETLELKVTQTQPALQFEKVTSAEPKQLPAQLTDDKAQVIDKTVVFKQVLEVPNRTHPIQNLTTTTQKLPADIIEAKVIQVRDDAVQLKLTYDPVTESVTYRKNSDTEALNGKNSQVTLTPQQLVSSKDQPLSEKFIANLKPGQTLFLQLKSDGIQPEFRVLTEKQIQDLLQNPAPSSVGKTPSLTEIQLPISAINPKIFLARVLEVSDDRVQLKLLPQPTEFSVTLAKNLNQTPLLLKNPIVTLSPQQLFTAEDQPLPNPSIREFRPGQMLILEIKKEGPQPEFRLLPLEKTLAPPTPTPLAQSMASNHNGSSVSALNPKILTAQVLQITDQGLQLKLLSTPTEPVSNGVNTPHSVQSLTPNSIITLSSQQIVSTESQPLPASSIAQIKPGQTLFFEQPSSETPNTFRLLPADSALIPQSPTAKASNLNELLSISSVNPKILAAQVLQVTDQDLQLKLISQPAESNATYAKTPTEFQSLPKDSVITLNSKQLVTAQNQPLSNTLIAQIKPGQALVLEINPTAPQPELRLLTPDFKPLAVGQSFQAQVVAIQSQQVVLQPITPSPANGTLENPSIDPMLARFRLTVPSDHIQLPDGKPLTENPAVIRPGFDLKLTVTTLDNEPVLKISPASVFESQTKPLPVIETKIISITPHKMEVALPPNTPLPQSIASAIQLNHLNQPVLTLSRDNFDLPASAQPDSVTSKPIVTSPINSDSHKTSPVQTESVPASLNPRTPSSLSTGVVATEITKTTSQEPLSQRLQTESTPTVEMGIIPSANPLNQLSASPENTETQRVSAIQLQKSPEQPPLATSQKTSSALQNGADFKNLGFKIGQSIHLQVSEQQGQVRFTQVTAPASYDKLIETTLKQMIPIQQSPVELLNTLSSQLHELTRSDTVPDALKKIAQAIIADLNRYPATETRGQSLQKALQHSGLFLEAQIFKPESLTLPVPQDLKNQLLLLKQLVEQALQQDQSNSQPIQSQEMNLLKDLQTKAESALARILLNQFQSLPKDDGNRQVWVMDLPVWHDQHASNVKVSIEKRKSRQSDENDDNWQVQLTLTPPGLGSIHCRITHFERKIDTLFWSDSDKATEKVQQNLDYLKQQFEQAGLTVGKISAQTVKNRPPSDPILTDNLLDHRV